MQYSQPNGSKSCFKPITSNQQPQTVSSARNWLALPSAVQPTTVFPYNGGGYTNDMRPFEIVAGTYQPTASAPTAMTTTQRYYGHLRTTEQETEGYTAAAAPLATSPLTPIAPLWSAVGSGDGLTAALTAAAYHRQMAMAKGWSQFVEQHILTQNAIAVAYHQKQLQSPQSSHHPTSIIPAVSPMPHNTLLNMAANSSAQQQQPVLWLQQQNATQMMKLLPSPTKECDVEIYSRKVFVGGIPWNTSKKDIEAAFAKFGSLTIEEPINYRRRNAAIGAMTRGHGFEIKGFVFLIFQSERSVKQLIESCEKDQDSNSGLFIALKFLESGWSNGRQHRVEIRPWLLEDADFTDWKHSSPVDARKAIFVGGVPRQMTAAQLAANLVEQFGPIVYAGIDIDGRLQYPKGAGRAVFVEQHSFLTAIAARRAHLKTTRVDKTVEVKPYVIEEIRWCDECQTATDDAAAFCDELSCLQFYCDACWKLQHAISSRRAAHAPQKKPPRRWIPNDTPDNDHVD